MGPVRQNPIQRTVSLLICVCIALCTIVAHNIAQNRPDSFPPYPPDNHHMQIICTSLQTDNHIRTSPLSFYRSGSLTATQPTASANWRQLQH